MQHDVQLIAVQYIWNVGQNGNVGPTGTASSSGNLWPTANDSLRLKGGASMKNMEINSFMISMKSWYPANG